MNQAKKFSASAVKQIQFNQRGFREGHSLPKNNVMSTNDHGVTVTFLITITHSV